MVFIQSDIDVFRKSFYYFMTFRQRRSALEYHIRKRIGQFSQQQRNVIIFFNDSCFNPALLSNLKYRLFKQIFIVMQ